MAIVPLPSQPDRPVDAWAQVCVRDRVTRYHRRGAGRAVLLLADGDALDGRGAGGAWPALGDALAARFRTIRPALAAAPAGAPAAAFGEWLRGFLDGLGIDAAVVVAAEGHGPAALAFAGTDAERVERVLLLERSGSAPPHAGARVPVLAVAARDPAALAEALAFVAGGAGRA